MISEPQLLKPSNSSCRKKARMFDGLVAAMAAIITLNDREMEAVISGRDITALAIELQQVRERQDRLICAYTKHVQAHGC